MHQFTEFFGKFEITPRFIQIERNTHKRSCDSIILPINLQELDFMLPVRDTFTARFMKNQFCGMFKLISSKYFMWAYTENLSRISIIPWVNGQCGGIMNRIRAGTHTLQGKWYHNVSGRLGPKPVTLRTTHARIRRSNHLSHEPVQHAVNGIPCL